MKLLLEVCAIYLSMFYGTQRKMSYDFRLVSLSFLSRRCSHMSERYFQVPNRGGEKLISGGVLNQVTYINCSGCVCVCVRVLYCTVLYTTAAGQRVRKIARVQRVDGLLVGVRLRTG